mgnify:CR=1 FL=1
MHLITTNHINLNFAQIVINLNFPQNFDQDLRFYLVGYIFKAQLSIDVEDLEGNIHEVVLLIF